MKAFATLLVLPLLLGVACGRSEIKGNYDVELQIAGATRGLSGTLILSTQPLDIPTLSEEDPSIDSEWFGGDAMSANSCFILAPSGSPRANEEADPGVVRVFEARIQPNGVAMPIEILNATDLRIEITRLQFFANALGGELAVSTERGVRPGRIHGTRTGSASPQRCLESLDAFRGFLRALPTLDDDGRAGRDADLEVGDDRDADGDSSGDDDSDADGDRDRDDQAVDADEDRDMRRHRDRDYDAY